MCPPPQPAARPAVGGTPVQMVQALGQWLAQLLAAPDGARVWAIEQRPALLKLVARAMDVCIDSGLQTAKAAVQFLEAQEQALAAVPETAVPPPVVLPAPAVPPPAPAPVPAPAPLDSAATSKEAADAVAELASELLTGEMPVDAAQLLNRAVKPKVTELLRLALQQSDERLRVCDFF